MTAQPDPAALRALVEKLQGTKPHCNFGSDLCARDARAAGAAIQSLLDERAASEKHRNDLADKIQDQLTEIGALKARIEELHHEAEIFDADHADQNRMVDRIADLIGLPHDQELDTTAFELWFSAHDDERAADKARIGVLSEALERIRDAGFGGYLTPQLCAEIVMEALGDE